MPFSEYHRPSENLGFPHWPNKVLGSIITSLNQMGEVGMISKNRRSCYLITNQKKVRNATPLNNLKCKLSFKYLQIFTPKKQNICQSESGLRV